MTIIWIFRALCGVIVLLVTISTTHDLLPQIKGKMLSQEDILHEMDGGQEQHEIYKDSKQSQNQRHKQSKKKKILIYFSRNITFHYRWKIKYC